MPGLQATYQARPFGPKKLNLRKVRKLLVALAPAAETRLPATPPPLPELLGGSADLTGSNLTNTKSTPSLRFEDRKSVV